MASQVYRDEQSGTRQTLGLSPQHTPALAATDVAQDLATRFDPRRFARLVALGQPLMPMVEEPAAHLEGEAHRKIARAFSASFDLDHLERKLGGSISEGDIMKSLFSFYDKGLIDFA